jgi:AraC-like DNA-binding protein
MIVVRTAFPNPALREFVRVFAQREVHPFTSGVTAVFEPVPARLEQMLEFELGTPFIVHHVAGHDEWTPTQTVIGAQVKGCARIELTPGVISFAIFFRPTGLSRLFGVPVRELSHQDYDAALISKLAIPLRDRIAECITFENRVHTVEEILLGMAARVPGKERMVAVAEHVFSLRGVAGVCQLANAAGLGVRHFEREFLREIGITPKLYARVARFQSALDAKLASPCRTWLEIAHSLHYHDQMHMIRDFQLLAGDTPQRLLSYIGDARPGALPPETAPEK